MLEPTDDKPDGNPPPLTDERIVEPRRQPFAPMRWRGELPHLEKLGGTYFVTFCLSGRRRRPVPRRGEAVTDPAEVFELAEPVSDGAGEAILTGDVAAVVENTLRFFHGERYGLHAWCVMPDHVHVVFAPFGAARLSTVVHSWKSYSANRINSMLQRRGVVWERECFDHLVRSADGLERFAYYTENNPVKAGLCGKPEEWPFSSARFRG